MFINPPPSDCEHLTSRIATGGERATWNLNSASAKLANMHSSLMGNSYRSWQSLPSPSQAATTPAEKQRCAKHLGLLFGLVIECCNAATRRVEIDALRCCESPRVLFCTQKLARLFTNTDTKCLRAFTASVLPRRIVQGRLPISNEGRNGSSGQKALAERCAPQK